MFKTFVVSEHGCQYGTTPKQNKKHLTTYVLFEDKLKFTPLQKFETVDSYTEISNQSLRMQIWIVSEKPHLIKIFGNETMRDHYALPETIDVHYSTLDQKEGSVRCSIIGENLVIPTFVSYPVFIKCDTILQLKK